MNLYWVSGCEYQYGVFIFTTSRNRAKMLAVGQFNDSDTYLDMRCQTLKKDVSGRETVVDCDFDEDYKRVTELGFGFIEGEYYE
jgi:hypothetical protein